MLNYFQQICAIQVLLLGKNSPIFWVKNLKAFQNLSVMKSLRVYQLSYEQIQEFLHYEVLYFRKVLFFYPLRMFSANNLFTGMLKNFFFDALEIIDLEMRETFLVKYFETII